MMLVWWGWLPTVNFHIFSIAGFQCRACYHVLSAMNPMQLAIVLFLVSVGAVNNPVTCLPDNVHKTGVPVSWCESFQCRRWLQLCSCVFQESVLSSIWWKSSHAIRRCGGYGARCPPSLTSSSFPIPVDPLLHVPAPIQSSPAVVVTLSPDDGDAPVSVPDDYVPVDSMSPC